MKKGLTLIELMIVVAIIAIIAAIAIPNLLRSRMAANEVAAVAACKAFCTAEDIYRRTDYNHDGVLEYAQALSGANSLFETTANAAISARLPYIMATSRFAHYLKVMARDKIGSFMEASNVETWLNRWIQNYVNPNVDAGQDMKARFPLREARVEVKEIPGKPGSYNAIAYLRPWLQMEELTTSLRMVASIPQKA